MAARSRRHQRAANSLGVSSVRATGEAAAPRPGDVVPVLAPDRSGMAPPPLLASRFVALEDGTSLDLATGGRVWIERQVLDEVSRVAWPEQMARLWRLWHPALATCVAPDGSSSRTRRASLFVAAEKEGTPQKKVRLIRAFLDEAHRAERLFPR